MSSNRKIKTSFSFHNQPRLVRGGKDYFYELEKMIDEAKESIQLQVYIYEEDHTGNTIAASLLRAAKRGVRIQVLLDGYASRSLSNGFKEKLRSAGIMLRFFEPILKSRNYYFGRRMHHKIVVCDGVRALVGGINISDRYNDMPDEPAWLDWAVWVEGDIAFELHKVCNYFYAKSEKDRIIVDRKKIKSNLTLAQHCPMRIRRNDWVMNLNQISATYMEMFREAREEVIIMSSYFLPSAFFKHNIIQALKRGVKIKLILAGMSDVGIAKQAERYLYKWAIRHGIEIYEYKHNILHGKMAVCDQRVTTVGSFNINDISALASIELNLDIEEPEFSKYVYRTFMEIIQNDCIKIHPMHVMRDYNFLERAMQWLSHETIRIIFKLFTFYFSKEKKS